MDPDPAPNPTGPFFLVVADHLTRRFSVEGPMVDDGLRKRAAFRAREHGVVSTVARVVWTGARSLSTTNGAPVMAASRREAS